MEKLEKYLDKEKIANAGGDICIIGILENTIKEQHFNRLNIDKYSKITDLIDLLYKTNDLYITAQENNVASDYYTEIEDLYIKIKTDTAKAVGCEKLWDYDYWNYEYKK